MQPDPLYSDMIAMRKANRFHFADPNLLHPYMYVNNNAVNWIDPEGLAKGDWWDPRTYLSVSFSYQFLVEGGGVVSNYKILSSTPSVGACLDISIGFLPDEDEASVEFGVGYSRFLAAGVFFSKPHWSGMMEKFGFSAHIGLGWSLFPFYINYTSSNQR